MLSSIRTTEMLLNSKYHNQILRSHPLLKDSFLYSILYRTVPISYWFMLVRQHKQWSDAALLRKFVRGFTCFKAKFIRVIFKISTLSLNITHHISVTKSNSCLLFKPNVVHKQHYMENIQLLSVEYTNKFTCT